PHRAALRAHDPAAADPAAEAVAQHRGRRPPARPEDRHLGRGASGARAHPARALQSATPAARIRQAPAGNGHPRAGHAAPAARLAGTAGRGPARTGDAFGGTGRPGARRARGAAPRGRGHRRRRRGAGRGRAPRAAVSALPVLFEDPFLAVVDKPAGLMVHDSALARGETDFAADRLREQFGKPIHLVHRLDRATSGCLLLAFDRDTASALGKQLMSDGFEQDYWAVCRGWPAESRFTIDHPLDGGPGKPVKKPAVTDFEVLATCELPIPSQDFETSRYALLCAHPR